MESIGSIERPVARTCLRAGRARTAGAPRAESAAKRAVRSRRLSDKVIGAFHLACDTQDREIAWQLLDIAERLMKRSLGPDGQERRREIVGLAAAHFRLWGLVHASKP